jgi:hypothetical protein
LAIGIVGPDPNPGCLGVRRARSREIHIDDRDRVSLEVDIGSLAGSDRNELAVWTCLDAKGAGLDRNARRESPGNIGFSYTLRRRRQPSTPKPASAEPSKASEAGSGTAGEDTATVSEQLTGAAVDKPGGAGICAQIAATR